MHLTTSSNINAERVVDFLGQLLAQVDAPMVLVWDRLNAHRAYLVQDFLTAHPQLATEFFPPYAPELNPIEYVWGYLKLNPLANLAFFDLEQLTTTARRHTRSLQRKPELLLPEVEALLADPLLPAHLDHRCPGLGLLKR